MDSVDAVVARVRRGGATPHVADGSAARTKLQMLDAIAAALDFPAYFGRNLDALWDCLQDLSWLPEGRHVLVWAEPQVLRDADPRTYEVIRGILGKATGGTGRPLTVQFARG